MVAKSPKVGSPPQLAWAVGISYLKLQEDVGAQGGGLLEKLWTTCPCPGSTCRGLAGPGLMSFKQPSSFALILEMIILLREPPASKCPQPQSYPHGSEILLPQTWIA